MQKCYVCFVTVCILDGFIHKTASEIMFEVGNHQPSEQPAPKVQKKCHQPLLSRARFAMLRSHVPRND